MGSGRRELNLRGRRRKHVLAFERLAASGASPDPLGIGLARLLVVEEHPSRPTACPPDLPPNVHTLSARAPQPRHKFEPPSRSSIPPGNPRGRLRPFKASTCSRYDSIMRSGSLTRPRAWKDHFRNFARGDHSVVGMQDPTYAVLGRPRACAIRPHRVLGWSPYAVAVH